MDRWALFRTLLMLEVCLFIHRTKAENALNGEGGGGDSLESCSESCSDIHTTCPRDIYNIFRVPHNTRQQSCASKAKTIITQKEWKRPVCVEGKGCDVPLNCFNFSMLSDDQNVIKDPPQVILVNPYELEGILENPSIRNCCAIVMFYAPWCEFSTKFARKYNALGRSFSNLPILALDFSEHEPYKYILAYLPVIAFYYRGEIIYRFKLTETYEELLHQVTVMTGFAAKADVDVNDEVDLGPVPYLRSESDKVILRIAIVWVLFVLATAIIRRSRRAMQCLYYVISIFNRTKND